jgi:hypothetical protein
VLKTSAEILLAAKVVVGGPSQFSEAQSPKQECIQFYQPGILKPLLFAIVVPMKLKEEVDLKWSEETQEWAERKGERPFGGGMKHVHGRIEDEFWGIDGGFRLEKSRICRY